MNPALSHLECTRCGECVGATAARGLCPCGAPYYARYDLIMASKLMPRSGLSAAPPSMWRYAQVLPTDPQQAPVSLGEGATPTVSVARLGRALDIGALLVKDETLNPTGSFKARGMSTAISAACKLGATRLALPSAGNAALAAAAYAARAGIPLAVYLPASTPTVFLAATRALGAETHLVEGSIADAYARMLENEKESGAFSLATLREPYRIEGKKTMGYEIAESLSWQLPDVIVYPTGGGTGLLGIWKAFAEMEAMGWIDERRPRMVAVQARGCAPIVQAFRAGAREVTPVKEPTTVASGLRVPGTIGGFIILDILKQSQGVAIAVSDAELLWGVSALARNTGIFAAPEAGATVAAARNLRRSGWIREHDRVLLLLTGTGLSYVESAGRDPIA